MQMKIKLLTTLIGLLAVSLMATSCLDDDNEEVEFSSNASITAFSINDIETQYVDSLHYDTDTTITVTLTGADYPFVIDQKQRLIYNADSLPVGTDVSKIVVNITADTSWILITDQSSAELKDTVWTSTDSLNFESPVKFKVVAYSGVTGATYTAKINVHKQVPDSLQWSCLGNGFDKTVERQKAVVWNGKVHVFARQGSKVALTTTGTHDGKDWTPLQTLDLPDGADYASAMAWGDRLYILAGNRLYCSTDGTEWKEAGGDTGISCLLAGVYTTGCRMLYAVDTENRFVESADGADWSAGEEVPAGFPLTGISYAVSPLSTNSHIDRVTVMGETGLSTDTAAIAWSRLTTESRWLDYPADEEKGQYCPKLAHIGMVRYNGRFYAFGGPGTKNGEEIPAFSCFYESENQGVSWSPKTRYMFFPESFADLYDQAEGNYSFAVDEDGFLWFIWSKTGQVWKGRVNKLGFDNRKQA